MRYILFKHSGDIDDESNNKAELIAKCRKIKAPATVEDTKCGGIIFENKAQRKINNEHQ